jgi:hypothetical protein
MAGDRVVMPENAFLMIHDPSGLVMGTAEDMRATADALDKVKGSLIQGYAAKSGAADEEIAALMAAETWLDAKDALDLGLIDRMAEPVKLAASFDVSKFRNAPPEVVAAAGEAEAPAALEPLTEGEEGASTQPEPEYLGVEAPTTTDTASVRAEAIAHARMVIDLCRLAGQPHMAGRFLEEDTDLDMVRSRLLAAKAEAEGLPPHSLHAQPGRGSASNPWGDVIARTFKTKG